MRFIIDLPSTSKLSGGCQRMVEFNTALIQAGHESQLHLSADESLPYHYDYIITYSDNPRINSLCKLAKYVDIKKVIVYQLSYGMALHRENVVVQHPDTVICCSTNHIKQKITSNKTIHYIGHSQESTLRSFYNVNLYKDHPFDVALMIHRSPDKRFKDAFEYCKSKNLKICLFGARNTDFDLSGAKHIIFNATTDQVRWVFSHSEKYLSLSSTEGLNRPGIEAMLCGCKPYIVDGCEIYKDKINCRFIKKSKEICENLKLKSYITLKNSLEQYTWSNVLNNLGKVLDIKL